MVAATIIDPLLTRKKLFLLHRPSRLFSNASELGVPPHFAATPDCRPFHPSRIDYFCR
jgi:hypothetical protein